MQGVVFFIAVLLIGFWAGIFVNYCADVLPYHRKLVMPVCLNCQASFAWANYLFWPRRCSHCDMPRHWRTWLVEVVYILVALGLWQFPHHYLGFWISLGVLIYLGIVVVIDVEHRLILHEVSLTGAVVMTIVGIIWRALYSVEHTQQGLSSFSPWWHGLQTTVLGGVVGFCFMWALYALGDVFLRIMARQRGQAVDDVALGFGDVNLAGVLGLWLGWPVVVVGLFFAIFIGGLVSLVFILLMLASRRYHHFMALPYGPFLVSGAVFVVYFRDLLLELLR